MTDIPSLARFDWTPLRSKRILMTGGTGFFGRWMLRALDRLNAEGHKISVLVMSRDPDGFFARYPSFRNYAWLEIVKGDIRRPAYRAERADLAIHAAADVAGASGHNPVAQFTEAVAAADAALSYFRSAQVGRVLLISSGAVYGPQAASVEQIGESAPFPDPLESQRNAYGEGKRAMELLGSLYASSYGLESIVARCFAFFGLGLPAQAGYAIADFVSDAVAGRPIRVIGDGRSIRSYLYGGDLAVWLLRLLSVGENGCAYNVGSDRAIQIGDLAYLVRDVLAPELAVRIETAPDPRATMRRRYVPSVARATTLGLAQWTDLPEGVRAWAADLRAGRE